MIREVTKMKEKSQVGMFSILDHLLTHECKRSIIALSSCEAKYVATTATC